MEKQYCKVGSVTPILNKSNTIAILQYRYEVFLNKAMDANYIDTKLGDFFKGKAQSIKSVLETLA